MKKNDNNDTQKEEGNKNSRLIIPMCFENAHSMAVLKLQILQEITVPSLKKTEGQKLKTDKNIKAERQAEKQTGTQTYRRGGGGGESSKQKKRSVKGLPDVFYASILQSQG